MFRLLALLFFPTLARLAAHRRHKLREAGWETTYDEASQTIIASGGPKFFLGNVLEDLLRASWWSRFVLIRRQDQALAEMLLLPPSLDDALARLLPRVNDRIFFESMRTSTQEVHIPAESLNDDLFVCLVVDSPNTTAYVSTAMLETWDRTLGDLLPVARANLLARTDPLAFETVAPGVLRSMHRDDFDDARVLLAPLLNDLPLRGRKLVCLASRNGLFVAGEDEPGALDHLLDVTSEAMEQESRAMNGRVHCLEGFDLVDFVAPDSNALHERRVTAYVRDIQRQREFLGAALEREHVDVYVADVQIFYRDGEPWRTVSTWTEGCETLLAEADELAFVADVDAGEPNIFTVPWPIARDLLGDALDPTDDYPRRYLATEFPDAEMLARLRELASIKA